MRLARLSVAGAVLMLSFGAAAGPVDSPVGCGGACAIDQAPVGCPKGVCNRDDYALQVGALSFPPPRYPGALEALRVTPPSPPVSTKASETNVTLQDLIRGASGVNEALRICTSLSEAPPEFWREALVQRNGLLACNKATLPLREQRELNAETYFAFLGGAPTQQQSTYKELFRSYKESCLQPLSQYQGTNPFQALFGRQFSSALLENVGLVTGKAGSSEAICTGSIIRLSDAPKKLALMTAAHCLGISRSMGPESSQIVSPFESIEFTSLQGQTIRARVSADVRGWIYPGRKDLAIIPVDASAETLEGLPIGDSASLKPWEPLYLVGINPVLMVLASTEQTGPPDVSTLARDAATITLSTPCRVLGVEGGRLLHNCETEKQMSGSPILVLENTGPKVVAVHTGGLDVPEPLAGCGPDSTQAFNQGVIAPLK